MLWSTGEVRLGSNKRDVTQQRFRNPSRGPVAGGNPACGVVPRAKASKLLKTDA